MAEGRGEDKPRVVFVGKELGLEDCFDDCGRTGTVWFISLWQLPIEWGTHKYPRLKIAISDNRVCTFICSSHTTGMGKVAKRTSVMMLTPIN